MLDVGRQTVQAKQAIPVPVKRIASVPDPVVPTLNLMPSPINLNVSGAVVLLAAFTVITESS